MIEQCEAICFRFYKKFGQFLMKKEKGK